MNKAIQEALEQWDRDRAKFMKTGRYEDLGIAGVKRDFLANPKKYKKI